MALLVTHIAAATASLVWMLIEWPRFGWPSLIGVAPGMVAGLATVTPASGFIGVPGGLILGVAVGVACYLAVDIIRARLRIDDHWMYLRFMVLGAFLVVYCLLGFLFQPSVALVLLMA